MCSYEYYITPEEYEIAEANGISKKLLECRIRDRAWSKEKAINTPVNKSVRNRYSQEIKDLVKKNGISMRTFKSRVNLLGWDLITAATTPTMDKRKNIYKAIPKVRKYPKKFIEMARKNGIPDKCFYQRIERDKWSIERAATTPVMTASEIGKINKEKRGKIFDLIFAKNKCRRVI